MRRSRYDLGNSFSGRSNMASWHLENAAEIASRNPYTFFKPSAENIAQVQPGEVVKLIFGYISDAGDLPGVPGQERLWVEVSSVDDGGHFTGKLDASPAHIEDLSEGDTVVFGSEHIIETQHAEAANLIAKYSAYCIVTKRVLLEGAKVGFLYRDPSERDEDSGWCITAGDESEEYMDDPGNAFYVPLGAVLNRDDSIIDLLGSEVGAHFMRGGNGVFVRVTG